VSDGIHEGRARIQTGGLEEPEVVSTFSGRSLIPKLIVLGIEYLTSTGSTLRTIDTFDGRVGLNNV
jgi:hypothetical protein